MTERPKNWIKVIRADAEDCYWVAPDGTKHPGTAEENAEVRYQLLGIRTVSDKRRQQKIAENE